MKKTQIIELIKNIKTTIVAFISITLFVGLSVGIYSGLSWVTEASHKSADIAYKNTNYHDLKVLYTYGYSDEDINILRQTEGTDIAEGLYLCYDEYTYKDEKYQTIITELSDNIDTMLEYEGTLPSKPNEVAIDSLSRYFYGIDIGDEIVFTGATSPLTQIKTLLDIDLDEIDLNNFEFESSEQLYLNETKCVVTAIIKSPEYLVSGLAYNATSPTTQQATDSCIYMAKSAFNDKAFSGYPLVLTRSNDINKYSYFSKDYTDALDNYSSLVGDKISSLANNKNLSIHNKVDEIVQFVEGKLIEADDQIKDAEKQIKSGKSELAKAKTQLEQGKVELENGENELAAAQSELSYYDGIFNEAKQLLELIKQKIEEFGEDYDGLFEWLESNDIFNRVRSLAEKYGGQKALDIVNDIINDIRTKPQEALAKLCGYIDEIINYAKNYLNDARAQIASGAQTIANGWAEYNNGLKQYNNGIAKIKESEIELAKAKVDYEDACTKFEDFKQTSKEIPNYDASKILRSQNSGIITIEMMCTMYTKLRYSMAALFVVVGALVCYSAISRIVNDQTKQIGTKKALGLSQKEITIYYLTYTSITLVLGVLVGIVVGYYVVEGIFLPVLNDFMTKKLTPYFSFKEMGGICLLEVILLLSTTYFACRNVFKTKTIKLLNGSETIFGKQRIYEKSKIWNKLSLLTQTIINNCFNEPRRAFSTIIGVAGCAALLVTSLTFKNNIMNSYKTQFDSIFKFDYLIYFNETDNTSKQIKDVLDNHGVASSEVLTRVYYVNCPDGSSTTTKLFVVKDKDSFGKLVNIEPYESNGADTNSGIWLGHSYQVSYKTDINDEIHYISLSGGEANFKASGFYNHYVAPHCTIVFEDEYKQYFEDNTQSNCYMLNSQNVDVNTIIEECEKIDGYVSVENFKDTAKDMFNIFDTLTDAMVLVYTILSIVMGFLVLLNLLSMFVDEKKKELIVLMINGYSKKEAKRYIYSDTIVLTAIGIIIGVIVGNIVGNISIMAFDSSSTSFMKGMDIIAIAVGVVGTMVLAFIISLISLRKIDKFKLTDINSK